MLQAIREKTAGWIAIGIVLLLCVPVAFFGINNYFETPVETYLAKVNDTEIPLGKLQERLQTQRNQMQQMFGDEMSLDFLETPDNKRRVLDSLVDETLRFEDAQAAGVSIPAAKLQQEILGIDAFKVNGQFNSDTYVSSLSRAGYTPEMFEAELVRDFSVREIALRMADSVFVTDAEVDAYLRLQNQTRSFRFLRVRGADLGEQPAPSAEDIEKYYKEHSSEFMRPEQVVLEYVEIMATDFTVNPPDEATLLAVYDSQASRFVVPEQRRASHILINVAAGADADTQKQALAKAEEALNEVKSGKAFADVAKARSEDPGSKEQGGDLGWIEKGMMDAAFEAALFSLAAAGDVSEPILGSNGYHIIKLEEVQAERRKTFAEARADLETEYQKEERDRLYNDKVSLLVEEIQRNPQSLTAPAEVLQLQVKRSDPLFKGIPGTGVTANPEVLEAAFSDMVLLQGMTSDLINISPEHVVAVRVSERKPEEVKPLEEVTAEVEQKLRSKAAEDQLAAKAQDFTTRFKAGTSLDDLAKELGKTVESMDGVVRTAGNQDPAVMTEVFKLARPSSGPVREMAKLAADDYLWIELSAVVDGDPKTVDAAGRDTARNQLKSEISDAEAKAYVEALRKAAVVTIAEDRIP
mgnify:CR=1 FL=1